MKSKNNRQKFPDISASELEALQRGDTPKDYSEHLGELRNRMFVLCALLMLFFGAAVYFNNYIIDLITTPLKEIAPDVSLKYDYMGESVLFKLKTAFAAALIALLPLVIIQAWGFIKPACEKKDRMFIRVLIFFGIILFYTGAFFSFSFITPFSIRLIEQFSLEEVESIINVSNYLHFLLTMILIFAVLFEMPVVISLLARLGIVTPRLLNRNRKFAVVVIWILAAMLTPPDIMTQMMIALPLMVLFELSVILSFFIVRKKKERP